MPRSPRFRDFDRRLGELRRHLLPPTRPLGLYSAREYDRVRGYVLLAHAEIESCLEDMGRDVADGAHSAWKVDQKPRQSLLSLMAFHAKKPDPVPVRVTGSGPRPSLLAERLNAATKSYKEILGNNHGIKEKNVLAILLPIGIAVADINSTWLNIMSSFGERRGVIAHRSAPYVQQLPDPRSQLNTVQQIRDGLKDLDEKLARLRK